MRAQLTLLLLFFLASQAAAGAKISEIKVNLDGDRVLTTFTLREAFDRRLAERVESGLPTSILYRFELARDRKRWWDQQLKKNSLEVVTTYDAVARAYTVHFRLDDKLIESRTVRERKALEEAMTEIERLPVFSVAGLPNDWRLLVKVQAEMGSRTVLSFIPVTINTDWKESSKFRAPGTR
ncbi:MAG TPA: DUF4390 domain-containing protein [Thermoanaerobaculia bacterium]|nr:DUF4390 domain-containing protein [Thermoanaerobaculia bacterium]